MNKYVLTNGRDACYNNGMSILFNGNPTEFSHVFIPKAFIKTFYDRGFYMDYHMHTNIEIAYLESGRMEVSELDGPTLACGPKQFMLIRKNKYHRLIAKSDDIKLLVLELATPDKNLPVDDYIAGASEFSCYPSLRQLMSSEHPISVFSDTNDMGGILSQLLDLLNAHKENAEDEFFELEYEIFIKRLLVSMCLCRTNHLKISKNSYINHALKFIADHYAEKITAGDVAQFIGVTPSYAQKLLRAATGMTVMKIVNFYRLKQSEFLITTTRLPLCEIAKAAGFESESNLYKNFQSAHGCSPSEYKNKNTADNLFYNFDRLETAKSIPALQPWELLLQNK